MHKYKVYEHISRIFIIFIVKAKKYHIYYSNYLNWLYVYPVLQLDIIRSIMKWLGI